MKINWKIEKQRGNFRPVLKYSISLEEHEKAIAMHAVNIESSIPLVSDSSSLTPSGVSTGILLQYFPSGMILNLLNA